MSSRGCALARCSIRLHLDPFRRHRPRRHVILPCIARLLCGRRLSPKPFLLECAEVAARLFQTQTACLQLSSHWRDVFDTKVPDHAAMNELAAFQVPMPIPPPPSKAMIRQYLAKARPSAPGPDGFCLRQLGRLAKRSFSSSYFVQCCGCSRVVPWGVSGVVACSSSRPKRQPRMKFRRRVRLMRSGPSP